MPYSGHKSGGKPRPSMICPICKEHGARRSRRHSVADYALSAIGVYPWRCRACHTRFHARLMALNDTFHAHCPVCGNLELQHISPEHVRGALSLVWRLLGVPALRCEPCRYKYFSVLPLRQTEPEEEPVRASSAD